MKQPAAVENNRHANSHSRRLRNRLRRLCVLVLAMLGTVSAHAQTTPGVSTSAPAPVKPETTLPKVEVTGNTDQYDARRYDTAAKIVVTQEEIVKFGDTTLADVLKRQPGITVNGGNAGRGGGEIRMRGLGAGYTQILLNGEAAPPGFTLDSLPPNQVERIEIVRAATAEFSTQAIAGTINIVLKTKVVAGQRELKVNVEGASVFFSPMVNLQISDKVDRLSYVLSANLRVGTFNQDSTQVDDGADASGVPNLLRDVARHNQGRFTALSLTPRLIWTLPGGDTLTSQTVLNLNHMTRDGQADWTVLLGPMPPYLVDKTQSSNSLDFFRTNLNWVHKYADGAKLDIKASLNASRRDIDFREQTYDAGALQNLDATTLSTAHDHGLTFVGKYSTPYAENHSLAAGWDVGSSQRSETRDEHDRPITGYVPVNSDEAFSATLSRLAVYAQDEWAITPKLSVYLGARWENLDTRSEGNAFGAIRHDSNVFSPLFQLLWKLPDSNNDQIRLALTRTYRPPGIARLIPRPYTSTNNSSVAPDMQGNPALLPELATGLDMAYEHFMGGGALLSASMYVRQLNNFIRNDVSFMAGRWVSMPINDGRAQTHGVALEAKFPLKLVYKTAPDVDLRANLARNWSSVDDVPGPNNRLADQTPLSANFGLDYKMSASFNMGGSFTYKTGGPIRISETSSSFSTIKREMDIYALWKLDTKRQLRLSAVNVLAQPHTQVAQYVDANGSLRSTSVDPFSVILRATLEMKF